VANSIKDLTYRIRVSSKAQRVRLVISPSRGLEVVVPRNFNLGAVPALIAEHEQWIRQKIANYPLQPKPLPQELQLLALGEVWQITYHPESRLREEDGRQIVVPDLQQLEYWLIWKAKKTLPQLLRQVSVQINLPYRKITVRSQKTTWASCSPNKDISLNYKLIFLTPSALRYVFVHELCHTIHLNHSPAFWQLVAQYEPNYQICDRSLREMWRSLPL